MRVLFLFAMLMATKSVASQIKTYSDLVALTKSNSVETIDELLAAIKDQDPNFLYNVSFVYNSRSLQSASPESPRVIIFGKKTLAGNEDENQMAIAFNSSGVGKDRLEVLEFDPAASQFQFHEIVFPADRGDSASVVFDDKPASCATCHGVPAKPIWDTYPVWPGVYGSVDNFLTPIGGKTPELDWFKRFLSKSKELPRYRHLTIEARTELSDYLVLSRRPNTRLTNMLSALNFKRAAAQARTWPRFNEFKFAVLGTAGMCFSNRPDNFIPGSLIAPIKAEFESLHARLTESAGKSHDDKVRRFFANQSTPSAGNAGYLHGFDQDYPQQIANLQVLAQAAGASIANWSIVMRPGTMEFANGQYGFSNFGESFLEEARKDPDLKKFLDNGGTGSQFPSYPLVNCANLAPLSVNAIQSSATLTSEKFLDSQSPILKCMSCHTVPFQNGSVTIETAGAAFYPFDEPMKLRPLLLANGGALADAMKLRVKKPSDDPEYMPRRPVKALSEEEKTAFVNFIDRLTN